MDGLDEGRSLELGVEFVGRREIRPNASRGAGKGKTLHWFVSV